MGQWRRASAPRCLVRFLSPCPVAEEIWSSLVQAKQVFPPAHDCCCTACPGCLVGFWSLRELEAKAGREEDREEPNGSRMDMLKKVDTGPSRNSYLSHLIATSLLCLLPQCEMPKSQVASTAQEPGELPFPQLSSCPAESHILCRSELAKSLSHFDSKSSQTGELQ